MTSWNDVRAAAPELATLAQDRIEATGLALLATIRRDGWPRLSGVEPTFLDGELWLGMMPDSRKSLDLQRDPRLALHNATEDKAVERGDVKITGRGVAIHEVAVKEGLRQDIKARTGFDPGTAFDLYRVDVTELATIRPAGDHLLIDSWRVGEAPKRTERR